MQMALVHTGSQQGVELKVQDLPRAIAYGEERRIRFSRPVCSEQVSASETLPILPGWNNPALELLICDCPGAAEPRPWRSHDHGPAPSPCTSWWIARGSSCAG